MRTGQRVSITLTGRLRRVNRKDNYFLYRTASDLKNFVFVPDDWVDPLVVTPGDKRVQKEKP